MGTIKKEGNRIYVQVKNQMRLAGEIQPTTKGKPVVLEMFRSYDKHLFKVWNSYGFSKEVMDHKDWFDYVLLNEETPAHGISSYMIPREDFILHGKEYEADGYERQYFMTKAKLLNYLI